MAMLMNAVESENHTKSAFFLDDDPSDYDVQSFYTPYAYTPQDHMLLSLDTKHAYNGVPFLPESKCPKSSLYKTELCKRFTEFGICRYGVKCQFAHGAMELRQVVRHPKYKTTKCKSYWGTGHCPYGSRCRFIHEEIADTDCLPLERSKSDPTNGIPRSSVYDNLDDALVYEDSYGMVLESAEGRMAHELHSRYDHCTAMLPNIQEAVDMLLKLSACDDKGKKTGTISIIPEGMKSETKGNDSDVLWKQFYPEIAASLEEEPLHWSMDLKDDGTRLRVFERFY